MRIFQKIGVISLWVFCLGLASQAMADVSVNTESGRFLYTQVAKSATLSTSQTNPKQYVLTLNDVSDTLYFADRPERTAGTMTTEQFVGMWPTTFAKNPPNASIVLQPDQPGAKSQMAAVELFSPKYDVTNKQLTYQAKPIGKFAQLTGKYRHTAMTIDISLCPLFCPKIG